MVAVTAFIAHLLNAHCSVPSSLFLPLPSLQRISHHTQRCSQRGSSIPCLGKLQDMAVTLCCSEGVPQAPPAALMQMEHSCSALGHAPVRCDWCIMSIILDILAWHHLLYCWCALIPRYLSSQLQSYLIPGEGLQLGILLQILYSLYTRMWNVFHLSLLSSFHINHVNLTFWKEQPRRRQKNGRLILFYRHSALRRNPEHYEELPTGNYFQF